MGVCVWMASKGSRALQGTDYKSKEIARDLALIRNLGYTMLELIRRRQGDLVTIHYVTGAKG
jgi:hypothetical protein